MQKKEAQEAEESSEDEVETPDQAEQENVHSSSGSRMTGTQQTLMSDDD